MNHLATRRILALFLLFCPHAYCFAQVDLAGLNGTVKDSSGRRIAAAHILAVQIDSWFFFQIAFWCRDS